ncbi:MAG: hypothetical protein AB8G26_14345, partial [Ilumatobacter sp.]
MASRQRQRSKLIIVALFALAACSSGDDTPGVSSEEAAVLPTDVAVSEDLIVATEDGLIPTPSTVPESIPAIDL